MPTLVLDFTVTPRDPGTEILVARLAEMGFEGFEETETGILAYIPSEAYDEAGVRSIDVIQAMDFKVSFVVREVEDQNWNSLWESSYAPVTLAGGIHIRASFHPERQDMAHQIIIDPKMSFGTAHHETTALMMEQMLQEDCSGKTVLDMGCGTAVLAILAERLGADRVVAIDIDANAVENARENIVKNNCGKVDVLQGGAESVSGIFGLILANINKNILVRDLPVFAGHLEQDGVLLMSGFYRDDLQDIEKAGRDHGLRLDTSGSRNNWTMARFIKG